MELKHLRIDGYKNIIDTEIEFQANETPIAIIGNNGTGKSNIIEAILHIFIGIYYDKPPNFNFLIKYDAHNKCIEVRHNHQENTYSIEVDGQIWSRAKFKSRVREVKGMPPFPFQIFTYYSGTCDRVKNLIKKYNRSYLKIIKSQTEDIERLFVFSDIEQTESIVLGLIAHRHNSLLGDLSIGKLDTLKITLQPPDGFMRERDEPLYWGTAGAIRDFLADIDNYSLDKYQPYDAAVHPMMIERRSYTLKTEHLEKIGQALERRGTNLYSMLQGLVAKDILLNLKFDIVHHNNESHFSTDSLSEGEKQLLCVIGGLTLSQNNECLVLLDEPDTHLNPVWSWKYDNLLREALDETQQKTSTTLIATHDPILISGLKREQVFIAKFQNNRLTYQLPYRDPRGQGVANVLTSEYFGLPSSLDQNTQILIDERLKIAYKEEKLTDVESLRLSEINKILDDLGLSISFRDPDYKEFEELKYAQREDQ